ncbi:hypothetical protein GCM10009789_11060 [Kribbella sancticallisti]|uniref:Uncharacterized protein n=1 Tax=Kribbella sancticallisti TaxID=460087 RepID=A0ABN2CJ77_9ACTN
MKAAGAAFTRALALGGSHHAVLQRVEAEPAVDEHGQITVEDHAGRELPFGSCGDVGEAVGQIVALPGPHSSGVVASDNDRAAG